MEQYSIRQQKVGRLIQKELADYFQRESRGFYKGKLISVTNVRITRDLSIARAYLSVFPSEGAEELLKDIRIRTRTIRGNIGKKVGRQLRIVPEMEFYIDDSLDYIDNINRLLNN